jgi:mRNA interferase RelE/StbE
MEYCFRSHALRQLEKLPKHIQKRIIEKLDFYFDQKKPLRFAERITDPALGEYRFRIGNYRVVFDIEKQKAFILTVGNRKDIYR